LGCGVSLALSSQALKVLGVYIWLTGGKADQHMAELVETVTLADLTPVAEEAGSAEGDPQPVYTWEGPRESRMSAVSSYPPSDGGAPRLIANVGPDTTLGVWDTGTGAFLGALQGPGPAPSRSEACLTYRRPSDGRPRIAVGSNRGRLCIWDGDDFRPLHDIQVNANDRAVRHLAVYEEPRSRRARLVTG
jgi:WD40 repeat protein